VSVSPAEVDLSHDQSRAIAEAVREELARRRISRQRLADDARISISTLEKALAGSRPFTLATTIRLEEALGRRLRAPAMPSPTASPASSGAQAPDDLGAYARASVRWLEGEYLTIRPSFEGVDVVFAYRTEIYWDADASALAFRETARQDDAFTQHGLISLPTTSGMIYLVTNSGGQYRLGVFGRPTIKGELYGLLTTLYAGAGAHLTPSSALVALLPMRDWPEPTYGKILPGAPRHAAYRAHLDRISDQGFARLLAR
jgi:transcriptional regulator with XRE-family HTH domain